MHASTVRRRSFLENSCRGPSSLSRKLGGEERLLAAYCVSFNVLSLLVAHTILSLFLFSTNLGSDRSCQQQQQHTADEKTTAWRRYCYFRCLPSAGIAHMLLILYFFFSSLFCFDGCARWRENDRSNHQLLSTHFACLIFCFTSNPLSLLRVVWSAVHAECRKKKQKNIITKSIFSSFVFAIRSLDEKSDFLSSSHREPSFSPPRNTFSNSSSSNRSLHIIKSVRPLLIRKPAYQWLPIQSPPSPMHRHRSCRCNFNNRISLRFPWLVSIACDRARESPFSLINACVSIANPLIYRFAVTWSSRRSGRTGLRGLVLRHLHR